MNDTLKTCVKCKQIKLVTNFGTDKTHKSGLQSWCRACKAAWARQYYHTTKGKLAHNRSRRHKSKQWKYQELLSAAQEILSDFNRYGEVLQVGDNGEYGTESAIGRLNTAIHQIEDD